LTELLPVTIMFVVIICLNISFTSGSINGVILFMQIVISLKLRAENLIHEAPNIQHFTALYKFIYRIFSLSFFSIEELSFCLWSGTNALDVLVFKYVTIVYSLLLVGATLLVIKACNRKNVNMKYSIINGLSAFLILSYSECARVSLLILTRGTLYTEPSTLNATKHKNSYVAFYNGEYEYMGHDHLKYAIFAIVFLATLCAIPPLLLLSYPLCYRVFALLRIDETKFVSLLCRIIPLESIKPLFDSIQGDLKDKYRFFSGLYFAYRLSILMTFTPLCLLALQENKTQYS